LCKKKNHVVCKFHYQCFYVWNKKFRTSSNDWELSIFTIIPLYTSKQNISIFEK
jgi:hypothetical protein